MAHETDSGASSALPAAGILAVLLVLAGGLILPPLQLTSRRPDGVDKVASTSSELQNVRVRLWQDPFAAIDQHVDKLPAGDSRSPEPDRERIRAAIRDVLPPLGDTTLTVIPVMVFGDSDVEDTEGRRRSRYAVMAALGVESFAPDDERHVGFFWTRQPPDDAMAPPRTRIPFEFAVEPRQRKHWVLVVWLDENQMNFRDRAKDRRRPLAALANLLGELDICTKSTALGAERNRVKVKVIGPQGSETLLAMAREASAATDAERNVLKGCLQDVRMFSIATSAVRSGLLNTSNVAAELERVGVDFLRTTKTDGDLAGALVEELRLRGVDRTKGHHIALVSEWDTTYARTLAIVVRDEFCRGEHQLDERCQREQVHKVSYLRGLDGFVPGRASDDRARSPRAGRREPGKNGDGAPDPEVLERPEGNAQVDYLRRLAASLKELDTSLDAKHTAVRAIGLLGSDPYDKLLVLQALREQHPNALFFTTDLDARLLDTKEYRWARNLIVVANFGLELNSALQKDVPPFRDSYQTATFYATRVALRDSIVPDRSEFKLDRDVERRPSPSFRAAQGKLDLLLAPRIFEIGRTRPIDLSKDRTPSSCVDINDCHDIYPPRPMFPQVRPDTKWRLPLAGLLGVALLCVASGRIRRGARGAVAATVVAYRRQPRRFWAWIVLGVVAVVMIGKGIVDVYLEWDRGEPIAFFEGVSLWPTELIRLLAAVLAIIFLARTRSTVLSSRAALEARFFRDEATQTTRQPVDQATAWDRVAALFKRVVVGGSGQHRAGRGPREAEPEVATPSGGVDSMSLWQEYAGRLRGDRYWLRIVASSALFYVFNSLIIQIFDHPSVPYRGDASRTIDQVLLFFVAVPLTIVLLFAVADAIRQCDRFTDKLATDTRTEWPRSARRRFSETLGVPEDDLAGWIDMKFIADWTARISSLIYYPSIIVLLMIVARSPIFDNWHMPIGLAVVLGLSLLYAVTSAFILRRAAERTRHITLRDLGERLIKASAAGESGRARQLELMVKEVQATRDGAFAPFSQQPLVRAVLLPLSGAGGATLLQMLLSS